MSINRTSPGGWVNPGALPKGPGGRALCRQGCGKEVPKGRRTFCSQECVDHWRIRTDPSYLRRMVFQRDRGICADCGRNCPTTRATSTHQWEADHIIPVVEGGGECDLDNLRTLCVDCHKRRTAALAARRAQERRHRLDGLFRLCERCPHFQRRRSHNLELNRTFLAWRRRRIRELGAPRATEPSRQLAFGGTEP